jgi:hypothetical protein
MHHIFNTNFEWELETDPKTILENSFSKVQKRFLSFGSYFANEGDTVFLDKPKRGQIVNSWAPSKLVEEYAKRHDLVYEMPDFEIVKKIQSKAFSHNLSPLPGSKILNNEKELKDWVKINPPPYVFKSFYGFSGTGHKFRPEGLKFPVLAEPWVCRNLDFSTQWFMKDGNLTYLGATILISDERGKYKETLVDKDEIRLFGENYPLLLEHKAFIESKKEEFLPFFGNIGFDAFSYQDKLQPLNETNARKTFGYLALFLLKQQEKERLRIRFDKKEGLDIQFE